jgi:hypothetical protein
MTTGSHASTPQLHRITHDRTASHVVHSTNTNLDSKVLSRLYLRTNHCMPTSLQHAVLHRALQVLTRTCSHIWVRLYAHREYQTS